MDKTFCRTKCFLGGNENFVRQKILSHIVLSNKVAAKGKNKAILMTSFNFVL